MIIRLRPVTARRSGNATRFTCSPPKGACTPRENAAGANRREAGPLVGYGKGGASAPSCPTFTDGDFEEVGKLLVEGRIRLPSHVRITVITTVEEVRSKIFGSTEVFAHAADQLHAHQLRPMFILDALEYGVLSKLGGSWVWRADVYKRLAPTDPRLI
jgi:hypothetical protein